MSKFYLNLITVGLITIYALLAVLFYPTFFPLAFLAALFIVVASTGLAGKNYGLLAYFVALLAIVLTPGDPVLSWVELFIRVGGFTISSIVLSGLIERIRIKLDHAEQQKNQLQIISDSLTEVLLTVNDKSIITFVNPAIKTVFGYEKSEVLGKPLGMLMPNEFRKKCLAGINRYLKTGNKTIDWKGAELVALRKDGTTFPVELSFGEFQNTRGRAFSAIIRDISLRKSYQLKLNELAAIVETSDDAIISKDLNGIIKTWNKGAQDIFGWTAEEAIGKPITIIFPEERKIEELRILETVKRGDHIAHYETVRKHKDGHLVDVSLSISPVRSANGQIIAVLKIARDVTYRKKQENEMRIAAERYKAFLEKADEAIWLIEYRPPISTYLPVKEQIKLMKKTGYLAEANPQMATLYGLSDVKEVIGQRIEDLPFIQTEESRRDSDDVLKMFVANDYSISNWESQSEAPNGLVRYGSTNFKGIIEDDKLVRAWVVQRETTQKRLQEKELKQSRERYRTFIENTSDAIWRTEFTEPIPTNLPVKEQVDKFFKQGYIAEANDATLKALNVNNVSDILNKPLESVGTRTAADDSFMAKFIENGYSLNDYESSEIKDGKICYTASSVKGILDGNNWIRAWVVRKDITPQKEAEVERERLLRESEKIRQDLEIAATEKDRFLANLSHELRTPLVAILGYSSMLLETEPDSENAKKMISTINKNAKLQVQLIEDLLDLSRIISGKIELKKEFFDVSEVVKDAIETFRHQATEKGLKIIENNDRVLFYGDKKRISQVVLNLLSNAVKFTEKGEIRICVKTTEEHLTIKVADTGIGIDPKNFEKLFKPFKQLDSSSTRAKQGLGLGLSIIKNIVDLHGGKVDVASKLGEGSEFKVYLPVVHPAVVEENIHSTQEPSVSFEGVSILLVEDDNDGGGFIKYLYEQKGAKVDWVESAKKAREMIATNKYSIYIFDLSMPEEDGISLMKSVREAGDTTKAVALTAFVDTYYEDMALKSGFDMFLKKPSSLSDLLSVIKLIR